MRLAHLLALVLAFSTATWANDLPAPNSVIQTLRSVPIVDKAPTGLLKQKGPKIGTLAPGTDARVLSIHQMQEGIGSVATWVEVQPLARDGSPLAGQRGWAPLTTGRNPNFR